MDDGKKRVAFYAAAALGLALVLYGLFFWSDDEDRILARLDQLSDAVAVHKGSNPAMRALKLKGELQDLFVDPVAVSVPELPHHSLDPTGLTGAWVQFAGRFETAEVGFGDVHIEIDDAGTSARVDSRATLSAVAFGGQPKRDVRDVRLELTNIDGEWKISSLTVGEASGDLF